MLQWQINTSKPLFNLWCFYISCKRSGSWGLGFPGVAACYKKCSEGATYWLGCLTVGGWLIEEIQYTYKQYEPYMFCALLFLHQQFWLWNHQAALGLWCISIVLYFQHNQWFALSVFKASKPVNLLNSWMI